jgi:hypothetical protein
MSALTARNIRRLLSPKRVNLTATRVLTSAEHAEKVITLNAAAGLTATLPAATGSGDTYTFVVGTTVTSNAALIKVANATDVMRGVAYVAQDGGDTMVAFEAGATADTIDMNGSTRGGIAGDKVVLIDIASGIWSAQVHSQATGTEATPFTATVS